MNSTTLKQCITRTLKKEFSSAHIYKDKQEKPKSPAFFVRYVEVSSQDTGNDFRHQTYYVEVRYMPGNIPANELSTHLELIGGQVVELLNYMYDEVLNFRVRATRIGYEIRDGALVVLATYDKLRVRIIDDEDGPKMQTLKENMEVL